MLCFFPVVTNVSQTKYPTTGMGYKPYNPNPKSQTYRITTHLISSTQTYSSYPNTTLGLVCFLLYPP